jgi:hypothetical protein
MRNETIHGNCACIQPQFSANITALRGKQKQSAPFEREENTETTLIFTITYFVFALVSDFEGQEEVYKPVRIYLYACRTAHMYN